MIFNIVRGFLTISCFMKCFFAKLFEKFYLRTFDKEKEEGKLLSIVEGILVENVFLYC